MLHCDNRSGTRVRLYVASYLHSVVKRHDASLLKDCPLPDMQSHFTAVAERCINLLARVLLFENNECDSLHISLDVIRRSCFVACGGQAAGESQAVARGFCAVGSLPACGNANPCGGSIETDPSGVRGNKTWHDMLLGTSSRPNLSPTETCRMNFAARNKGWLHRCWRTCQDRVRGSNHRASPDRGL